MKTIGILKNTVQDYAWGALTAIPELLGEPVTGNPQAELWMGAHPKAPSDVVVGGSRGMTGAAHMAGIDGVIEIIQMDDLAS